MRLQPELNLNNCEMTLNGVRENAPEVDFGGYKSADFEVKVDAMREIREEIESLEVQIATARARRELIDQDALAAKELIVNGIIGNPAYGPDSPLYAAIGYVRKSDRKSGLKRGRKNPPTP